MRLNGIQLHLNVLLNCPPEASERSVLGRQSRHDLTKFQTTISGLSGNGQVIRIFGVEERNREFQDFFMNVSGAKVPRRLELLQMRIQMTGIQDAGQEVGFFFAINRCPVQFFVHYNLI